MNDYPSKRFNDAAFQAFLTGPTPRSSGYGEPLVDWVFDPRDAELLRRAAARLKTRAP